MTTGMPTTRMVEVRAKVLKQNDLLAAALRDQFRANSVCVVGLVSSPGSGKTAFLEKLLAGLAIELSRRCPGRRPRHGERRRPPQRATPNVKQITTGTICHLDAQMVQYGPRAWEPGHDLDFLFIENVGNLVCPSSYDLGEELRFVLLSATEGEDKPLKYPTIFNSSDVAIITKMDMAQAADFDVAAARRNIESVRPGMKIFEVSSKTGAGMQQIFNMLRAQLADSRESRAQLQT